jgi:hypothetical protein
MNHKKKEEKPHRKGNFPLHVFLFRIKLPSDDFYLIYILLHFPFLAHGKKKERARVGRKHFSATRIVKRKIEKIFSISNYNRRGAEGAKC